MRMHSAGRAPIRLLAVVVLYKIAATDSMSFKTLMDARAQTSPEDLCLRILLYDNTPGGQEPQLLPDGVLYETTAENAGLASAYNRALCLAETEGFDWLLTLDQDTALPASFMKSLSEAARKVEPEPSVAAILPIIVEGDKVLSPHRLYFDSFVRRFPREFSGVTREEVNAINSAATLRVSTVREVGGYNPLFWLDRSDTYLFHRLHLAGKKVYVASNIQVEHELSMRDFKNRVTPSRYRNMVEAGSALADLEFGLIAGLHQTASLFYRLYRHWERNDDPAIRRITIEVLKKRLFTSKQRRIADFKQTMADPR